MDSLGIAFSGGLDSYLAACKAQREGREFDLVNIDLGVGYNVFERAAIAKLGLESKTRFIDMSSLEKSKTLGLDAQNIMIPGRNLLITDVLAQLGYDEIWIPAVRGEFHRGSTDKNILFFVETSELLSRVYGRQIVVTSPFTNMGKLAAVKEYMQQCGDAAAILATRSCLSDKPEPCGECTACVRRAGVFHQFGIQEKYAKEPVDSRYVPALLHEWAFGDDQHFLQDRFDEVLPMLSAYFENRPIDWKGVDSWTIDLEVSKRDYAMVRQIVKDTPVVELAYGGVMFPWKKFAEGSVYLDPFMGNENDPTIGKYVHPESLALSGTPIVCVNSIFYESMEGLIRFINVNRGVPFVFTCDVAYNNAKLEKALDLPGGLAAGTVRRNVSQLHVYERYTNMFVEKILISGVL